MLRNDLHKYTYLLVCTTVFEYNIHTVHGQYIFCIHMFKFIYSYYTVIILKYPTVYDILYNSCLQLLNTIAEYNSCIHYSSLSLLNVINKNSCTCTSSTVQNYDH